MLLNNISVKNLMIMFKIKYKKVINAMFIKFNEN